MFREIQEKSYYRNAASVVKGTVDYSGGGGTKAEGFSAQQSQLSREISGKSGW